MSEQLEAEVAEMQRILEQEMAITAAEAWARITEFVAATMEGVRKALEPVTQQIIDLIGPFILIARRESFRQKLIAHRVPERIAGWISRHWPEGLLPGLKDT